MSLPVDWNTGGDALAPKQNNKRALRDILHALTGLSLAAMTAIKPQARFPNMPVQLTNGLWYHWNDTTALADDGQLVQDADDTPALGAWLVTPGQEFDLVLPVGFATADAAVLYTAPTGAIILPMHAWWDVSVAWTGGTSSAIGLSSDAAGAATQGDLLGGAGGDLLADLTIGAFRGSPGAVIGQPPTAIVAAEVLRFDRIVSAFTAGAANAHVLARVLANAGA